MSQNDRVWLTYNRQGQRVTTTAQRGCVHTYEYDRLGRLTDDRVTTLGTNVDGRVRRLGVAYEVRGLPQVLSSYDAESLSGGTVLNQARFEHNNYGQRVSTYQAQTGAVNVSATPRTQTSFADGAANTVRPVSLTYPDGRVLNFDYGAAGSMSDRTSRIAALTQGSTTLAEYEYLGRGAVVRQTSPEANLRMTLVDLTGSNDPDTGDIYAGLDRFGRVDDVRWRNTSTSSDLSRVKYGYNRASSRTWRVNPSDAANQHDWQYGYDGLQRLTRADRGTLNFAGSQPSTINPQLFSQCWTLDATENWAGFRQDDDGDGTWNLAQSRTNNVVNELTGITNTVGGSWQVPAYDPAGNMTTIPQPLNPSAGYTATYDAWNRLVKLTAAGGFQEEYRYDARNYRVTQVTSSETRHFYHTNAWQVLEERLGTTPDTTAAERQFTWGLRYIDDLILRDRDTDNNGTLDERLYALQDANWNVTAVVTMAGTVSERYEYDPYGTLRVLTPTFGTRTTSNHAWETTYAGYRYNPATGLYHVRFRVLTPIVGWAQRDPYQYIDSRNLYPYTSLSPLSRLDATGLLLLAIDGTSTREWLEGGCNPHRLPNGRWLSHVRNFHDSYGGERIYDYGPDHPYTGWDLNRDTDTIYDELCESWCRNPEPIDMVGWSRGGFMVIQNARRLQEEGCCCNGTQRRNIPVRFLGLYDPVDMCPWAGDVSNLIPTNVGTCATVFGEESGTYEGVDYDWGIGYHWPRIDGAVPAFSPTNALSLPLNCTHGAIGGCPGYSGNEPSQYNYPLDRSRSIVTDIFIRQQAIAAGVPVGRMDPSQYGFPALQSQLPQIQPRRQCRVIGGSNRPHPLP